MIWYWMMPSVAHLKYEALKVMVEQIVFEEKGKVKKGGDGR